MLFLGDNTRFGTERIDLGEERFVDPTVRDDDSFPFGMSGLVPVSTSRKKKGGCKTVYAFPFAEGEPGDDALAQELVKAVDFVNLLLSEAAELSGHDFGSIGGVWLGVPEKGYAFTRVEKVPSTGPAATPVHLRIETTSVPGEPGSLSAVLEYDAEGYVRHVLMTECGEDGATCSATASLDYDSDSVLIDKVTETLPGERPACLYYRQWRRSRDEW